MADSLNDVLVKVSAVVSQTTSVTDTSDEYALWRSFVNMSQREWAESSDWPNLYTEFNSRTSIATSVITVSLPSDFRKLATYPRTVYDGSNSAEMAEIDPQKKTMYNPSSDHYCYVLENTGTYSLIVNPTITASGASIFVGYWRSVASLVSPADKIACPNPEYIVQRTIAHIWEAREDGRFTQAKAEADRILANMLEMETAKGEAYIGRIQTPEELRHGFRIGRD